MKKLLAWSFILIMIGGLATGCESVNGKNNEDGPTPIGTPIDQQQDSHETDNTLEETVTYMGQIDSNSIEVKLSNGEYQAVRLTQETKDQLADLKDGNTLVLVTYELNDTNQWVAKNIEIIEHQVEQETVLVRFMGQADANSIEIQLEDDSYMVARLSEQVKSEITELDLESKTLIEITYEENEHGQWVIQSMELQ